MVRRVVGTMLCMHVLVLLAGAYVGFFLPEFLDLVLSVEFWVTVATWAACCAVVILFDPRRRP